MENKDETFLMKCPNCYGAMKLDDDREYITCPYCGTQLKYEESDDVKMARIKAQAQRDADIEKEKLENEYKIKHDQIYSSVDAIKSGAQIVNEGTRLVNEGAKVANTAKSIVKLIIVLAVIGILGIFLVIGCTIALLAR